MANSPLSEFNVLYITQPCDYQLVAILAGGRVIQPPVPPRYICALQVGIFGLRHIDEAAPLAGARRLV